VIHNIDSGNDDELQRAIHLFREETQYAQRARQQCGQYEHGGGSSQQQSSGGLFDRLKRSISRKGKVIPFKLGLTPGHGHQRVSKTSPQLVRHVQTSFTLKSSPMQKLAIHTSL
jgi:hypothetical protein